MKRLLPLFAALVALAGCTGTTAELPDVLLIVGYTRDGGKVGLIQADTLCRGPDPRCAEQEILPGSERELPAPPVHYDLTDRGFARSELVVLSRQGSEPNGPAYLSFFDVTDLPFDDPTPFQEDVGRRVTLSPDLPRAPGLENRRIDFCPTRVQVSLAGNYAAILNDNRGVCNSPTLLNSVVILELAEDEDSPRIVAVRDDNVLPRGLHLVQAAENRLFYLQEATAGARIMDIRLVPGFPSDSLVDLTLDLQDRVADLRMFDSTLLALRNADFVPIANALTAPVAGTPVPTGLTSGERLVVDAQVRAPQVLVIGGGRVSVHQNLTDQEPQALTISGVVDGTIDISQFAYFLSPGAISTFDLLLYAPPSPPRAERFEIEELTNPSFITWVLAEAPFEPPVP